MRLYKKFCYQSKDYKDCIEVTSVCASKNNCDYLIELDEDIDMTVGYLLMQE